MPCKLSIGILLCFMFAVMAPAQETQPGYDDTPVLRLAGGRELPWRVHDRKRPRPELLQGLRCVETPAPSDASVLFGGKDCAAWRSGDKPAAWAVREGCMLSGGGDIRSADNYEDIQLHIEWRSALDDKDEGQARSNSGVFLMDRYEVQILESHGSATYADGQAAALYGQWPPLVNATAPAGEWNSYDIAFIAPRFDAKGGVQSAARVTVLHNGVIAQLNQEFLGATAHRTLPAYKAHGPAPLRLQDHGDAVSFRNIWVRRLETERPVR